MDTRADHTGPPPARPTTRRPAGPAAIPPATGVGTSEELPAPPRQTGTDPARQPGTRRRVQLATSRLNPWSILKISFLLSVGLALAGVGLTAGLWLILSETGVFTTVQTAIDAAVGSSGKLNLMDYLGFSLVISFSIVIGVINMVLITALTPLAAVLYNVCSRLVGGLQLTLTDD